MKPLYFDHQEKNYKLVCRQHKNFPPLEMLPVIVKDRGDVEQQRASGYLKESRYQQILTWQRNCGLLEMEEKTCRACKNCQLADYHPIKGEVLKELPNFMKIQK